MAVNKVIYNTEKGEEILIDLTGDTADPDTVSEGVTFHGADGEKRTGTNPYAKVATDATVGTQADLIAQIKSKVNSLPQAGASGGNIETCHVHVVDASSGLTREIKYLDSSLNVVTATIVGEFGAVDIDVVKNSIICVYDPDDVLHLDGFDEFGENCKVYCIFADTYKQIG